MHTKIRLALGTIVKMSVEHPDADEAKKIMELSFQVVQRIDDLMNVYRPDSEIGRLNRQGFCRNVSRDTLEVLKRAIHFSTVTGGAFDITVERGRGNCGELTISGEEVLFNEPGMGVNLGGIAKGYAVDKAVEVFRANGIERAIVDAGGDIKVLGGRTNETGWTIGVRDPRKKKAILSTLQMRDLAITTSGTYRRDRKDIIHPETLRAVDGIRSSTVFCKDAMDADALSTSIYVMGPEQGLRLIESMEDTGALMVTEDGDVLKSSLWEDRESRIREIEKGTQTAREEYSWRQDMV